MFRPKLRFLIVCGGLCQKYHLCHLWKIYWNANFNANIFKQTNKRNTHQSRWQIWLDNGCESRLILRDFSSQSIQGASQSITQHELRANANHCHAATVMSSALTAGSMLKTRTLWSSLFISLTTYATKWSRRSSQIPFRQLQLYMTFVSPL